MAGAARGPVLVFGDLPPASRDIDVLVKDEDLAAVERSLRDLGFVGRGHAWVKFHRGHVTAVDLFAGSSWQLPPDELRAVFADAAEETGLPDGVVRPAAHHRLLLLARRLDWGGAIDERRGRRLAGAMDGVDEARERAAAWGLAAPLERLLAGETQPRPVVVDRPRLRLRRKRRPVVVALSGIDGSGKSSLAEGLQRVLGELGMPVTVVWARLEWSTLHESRALARIAAPVKAVINLMSREGERAPTPPAPKSWLDVAPTERAVDPAGRLRERSALVTTGWTAVVAALHAYEQRRVVRAAGPDGVVVCDRYTLDSVVHLQRAYGGDRSLPLANRVLMWLSPRADVAILLDVPADVAIARKQDEFDEAELASHAERYRALCRSVGVRPIDATAPAWTILDAVATDVWLAETART